ncbi:hypothetical protein FOZ60_001057 [Perkinsus olseni]|uniref:Uncharacterized protein n=1 Tax=Perkinsus olseni TaxID=32597 RepID=A0A7J6P146_PEROL|nr:hypothetical protein FOZ60_001057 [Perkinsus olseni]
MHLFFTTAVCAPFVYGKSSLEKYRRFENPSEETIPIETYHSHVEDDRDLDRCVVHVNMQKVPWIFFVDWKKNSLNTTMIMCPQHIFHYDVTGEGVAALRSITAPTTNPQHVRGRIYAINRERDPLPEISRGSLPRLRFYESKKDCKNVLSHLRSVMVKRSHFGTGLQIPERDYQLTEMHEDLCKVYEKVNAADVKMFEDINRERII